MLLCLLHSLRERTIVNPTDCGVLGGEIRVPCIGYRQVSQPVQVAGW
jgi:hypothetical protein